MIPQTLTFYIAKSIQLLIQKLGKGGGTALPGLIAYRLNKKLLASLAQQLDGSIVIVGTNGKTTTSRMLSTIIESSGRSIINNRSGSNMTRGVLSTLIARASWGRQLSADWGVFEVDEAYFPEIAQLLRPKYVIMLNLFRDQLDRYGEISSIAKAWRAALRGLDAETTVLYNADDPSLAHLAKEVPASTLAFGLQQSNSGKHGAEVADYGDSQFCPACNNNLSYSQVFYSHLGDYACRNCGFDRPDLGVAITHFQLQGMDGSEFRVYDRRQTVEFNLRLAGLYNIYNALAAIALSRKLSIEYSVSQRQIANFQAAFGRLEEVQLSDCRLVLILVKNPTGFNQVLQTLSSKPQQYNTWFLLNDNVADGRDVSWIWDVDLESFAQYAHRTVVGGTRSYDMALRVKYADFNMEHVAIAQSLAEGLRLVTSLKEPEVYCLCTYTAMLQLRKLLQKNRAVQSYHMD